MSTLRSDLHAAVRRSRRAKQLLSIGVTVVLLVGMCLAVARPPWLTEPLRAAVQSAGAAAPVVFVLLSAATAPLHVNGVLVALSTVIWPLPVAAALSYTGSMLGCFLTFALLSRVGGAARQRDEWPAWLRRLSSQATDRPLILGMLPRIAIGSGLALEAFYVLTGYTWRNYLIVTTIGIAVWVTQTLLGVTVLHTLVRQSPGLAVLAAIVPMAVVATLLVLRRNGARSS